MPTTTSPIATRRIDPTARSRQLRAQARDMHPLVARAMRRRACELDLQAWVLDVVRDGETAPVRAAA